MRGRTIERDDVLIEFHRVGNAIRVVAIDQASGAEVVIIGPAKASREHLSRTAADKLRYVLRAKAREAAPPRKPGFEV